MKLWTIRGVVQSASSFLADRHVKGIVLVQRQHSIFAQETASLTLTFSRPGLHVRAAQPAWRCEDSSRKTGHLRHRLAVQVPAGGVTLAGSPGSVNSVRHLTS